MNELKIAAYAASNVGKRRQNNEDNYFLDGKCVNSLNEASAFVTNKEALIVSVCDGMGGEEAGEVASQIAVNSLKKRYNSLLENNLTDASIEEFVSFANEQICSEISKCKKRMGTTYTLLGVKNGVVTASNIGDSRIYRFSKDGFQQLSRDHTEAQTMVDSGIISAEESTRIPEKHRLTQHLGIYPYEMVIEPFTVRINAVAGDKYLLCSDGLTDMLTDTEITDILTKNQSLMDAVNDLITAALQNGGKDNVTVVLCELTDEECRLEHTVDYHILSNQKTETEKSIESKESPLQTFYIVENNRDLQIGTLDELPSKNESLKCKSSKKKGNILLILFVLVVVLIMVFFVSKMVQSAINDKTFDKTITHQVKTQELTVFIRV